VRKFTLTIEMGNEAMSTCRDVRVALYDVAQRLFYQQDLATNAYIRDENGNTVGAWAFTEENGQ
jgi:hypothetical protein